MFILKRVGKKNDRSEWYSPVGAVFYSFLTLSFPFLFLLFTFLSMMPLTGVGSVPLNFSLALIYHWSVYRRLSLTLLIFMGALQDLYLGMPLGVHILENLGIHGIVERQGRFLSEQTFLTNWIVFGIILFFDLGLKEVLIALIDHQFIPLSLGGWSILFSFLLYPACVKFFIFFDKITGKYIYDR